MAATVFVGCAMWANRAWVGPHFPASTRAGDELAQYAQWCTAVEGNTTFYALPPADTVRRWAAATPASFRFMFKLPRTMTHDRRLRGVDADLVAFLRLLDPLGERLGPISIQLPASFGPGDLGILAAFLRAAPRHVPFAVEVRHPQFFDGSPAHGALDRLVGDFGAERIILDARTLFSRPPTDDAERETWKVKPRLPVAPVAFSSTPIVRFIGRTDEAETVAGWQPWLPIVAGWVSEGRSPIVFVHTPDNVAALGLARRLHAEIRALAPAIAALPTPTRSQQSPSQGSLFD